MTGFSYEKQPTLSQISASVETLVEGLGVIRTRTLIRLLEHIFGSRSDAQWQVIVHRLIKTSSIERVQYGRGDNSVISSAASKNRELFSVQAQHELRVAEVAVEFIRQGFDWVPTLYSGVVASKVSDGVAWLDGVRIDVEVELSAKKQSRWAGIIKRYNTYTRTHDCGIVYIFGSDGLQNSFKTVMEITPPFGWWHLAVSDGDDTTQRQVTDEQVALTVKQAITNREIKAYQPHLVPQQTHDENSHPTGVVRESDRLLQQINELNND